jgi:hypothetical protein
MDLELEQRERLTAYLLGKLPEPERLELAARYFEDDELFDRLLEVEDDLLDRYVRGQLDGADRKGFESYLRRLPEGKRKALTAAALTEIVAGLHEPPVRNRLRGWLRRLRDALAPKSQSVFRFAPVAAMMLAAIGIAIWLFIGRRQLQERNSSLQERVAVYESRQSQDASLREQVQTLTQEAQSQRARAEQMQNDLAKLRRQSEEHAREIARLQFPSGGQVSVATLLLPWLALRPINDEPAKAELSLEPHHRTARFTVPIKGTARNARYGAELRTGNGEVVWRRGLLPPRPSNNSLSFHIPAALFKQADYIFKLNLITPSGMDLSREYKITVTQK